MLLLFVMSLGNHGRNIIDNQSHEHDTDFNLRVA